MRWTEDVEFSHSELKIIRGVSVNAAVINPRSTLEIDQFSVIRNIHKLGSPMPGVVTSLDVVDRSYDIPGGFIHLATASEYPAVLSYHSMNDDPTEFDESKLPSVGDTLNTVVFNFVDGNLYLTANPSELAETRIEQWRRYYEYIDTIKIGTTVSGLVNRIEPFGLFVDIGSEFIGLIDIGHSKIVRTPRLPHKQCDWPSIGTRIKCKIEYLRLHSQQLGLGWLPETGVSTKNLTSR